MKAGGLPITWESIQPHRTRTRLREPLLPQLVERLRKAERPLRYVGNGMREIGKIEPSIIMFPGEGTKEGNQKRLEVCRRIITADTLAMRLVNALGIPVVTSWNAADLVPNDHPLWIGRPGTYGQRGANFALQSCDFLLCVGARMSIPQTGYDLGTFAPKAWKCAVDVDKAELIKLEKCFDMWINADAGSFTEDFLHELEAK